MNVILDLYQVKDHAQQVMRNLGVSYAHSVPQSLFDCWVFFGCENLPNPLPEFMRDAGEPHGMIGHGLTLETAEALVQLERLKSRAQFFKAGAIIPRRVLKCSHRKLQHIARFGAGHYVLPGRKGYVCFSQQRGTSAIDLRAAKRMRKTIVLRGSPYHPRPSATEWVHCNGISVETWVANINAKLAGEPA